RLLRVPGRHAEAEAPLRERAPRRQPVPRLGIDALPVVEIKEHGRALRRRAEQIAELAEHVRTDRVALVLGEVLLRRPLAREDIEVVETEIGEHFLEPRLTV